MIDMKTRAQVYTGAGLPGQMSQQVMLAHALYGVEVAHTRLKEPGMTAEQSTMRGQQLDVALEAYWQIDNQIEAYLERAREN